ncbi:hypothetical protein ACFO3J_18950 [Streptomyces polygonati]|uniref:Secreted protein n=1 Tax=Streptomyces polygonati TaxID=1617087 RepID=A0ABV8HNH0_9ACTN
MSDVSRRSLLGYTGTAVAGTVLAGAGTAQAAPANTTTPHTTATTPSVVFAGDTKFSGYATVPTDFGGTGEIDLSFTVGISEAGGSFTVTPLEIANALNALLASHGWPPVTFYGSPAPVALN